MRECGISSNTVNKYETSIGFNPCLNTLDRFAYYYGVRIAWLLTGEGEKYERN